MLESRRIKIITGHGFRGCLSLCLPKFADVYQWNGGIEVGLCEVTFGKADYCSLPGNIAPILLFCPHHNTAAWEDNGDVSRKNNGLQMHAVLVGLSQIQGK